MNLSDPSVFLRQTRGVEGTQGALRELSSRAALTSLQIVGGTHVLPPDQTANHRSPRQRCAALAEISRQRLPVAYERNSAPEDAGVAEAVGYSALMTTERLAAMSAKAIGGRSMEAGQSQLMQTATSRRLNHH